MKKNFIINDLEVFYKDLPPRNLFKARVLCSALKDGNWRLPTHEELTYLYDLHNLGIMGFKNEYYWSYKEISTGSAISTSIHFNNGMYVNNNDSVKVNMIHNIRPVRIINK